MAGYIDGKVDIWYGVNPPLNNNILWMQRSQPYNFEPSSLYEFNNQTQEWVLFAKVDPPVEDNLNSTDGFASLSANQGRVLNISKVDVPASVIDGEIVTFDGATGRVIASSGVTPAELQLISNKVTAWSTPLDTQYPSAKLVKDTFDGLPALPTIVQTTGVSTTSIMSQDAVTDALALKQPSGTYSTDIHGNLTALNAVSGTNTGDETLTSVGALIGTAGDATPLDSDNIATALSAGGILKKLTWTAAKAFLKTYFDTLYLATTKRWELSASTTIPVITTTPFTPEFTNAIYKADLNIAGNSAISWIVGTTPNLPISDSCTTVYLKNVDTATRTIALHTADCVHNGITYSFNDITGGTISVATLKVLEISYLFVFSSATACRVNIITKIQA